MAIGYLFLFYATIQIGMILGKKQILSPWLGAWFSNIVFSVSGIFMMRKTV
jgi:lipopolysaccharide export LptBFGC system permease protein LptF